jgi:hypothetical protein
MGNVRNLLLKANFKVIEEELKNYQETKKQFLNELKEIEQDAYPKASGGNVEREGDIVQFAIRTNQTSDPTLTKTIQLIHKKSSRALMETEKRLRAIEEMIDELKNKSLSPVTEVALDAKQKLDILEEKYMGQNKVLNDQGIMQKIHVSSTTFYRMRYCIIKEVADKIGWEIPEFHK